MARLAKKIKINQVLNVDRQKVKKGELPKKVKPLTVKMVRAAAHIDRQTDYIPKDDLDRIISVARAHALWLHMDVLKHVFKFTGKQLMIYRDKLKDVYVHIHREIKYCLHCGIVFAGYANKDGRKVS